MKKKGKAVFKGKRQGYTLPLVGKTFRKRNLPKISGAMYSRLSQIYGIPIKELTPVHVETTVFSFFKYPAHRISIGGGGFRAVEHELIHSVQRILEKTPRMERRRWIKNIKPAREKLSIQDEVKSLSKLLMSKDGRAFRKFYEPSAHVSYPQIYQPFIQSFSTAKGLLVPLLVPFGLKALPPLAVFLSPEIGRGMITRHYYKKHGSDGLILLFADPPKNMNLLHLKSKEKEFVERGYLKERGGFTPKGLQYLRQIMPRGLILERLQDFKKYRRRKK